MPDEPVSDGPWMDWTAWVLFAENKNQASYVTETWLEGQAHFLTELDDVNNMVGC